MSDDKKSDDIENSSDELNGDDELFSDFHDLFPDDTDESELGETSTEAADVEEIENDSELDELNSILDDFEKKLGAEDEADENAFSIEEPFDDALDATPQITSEPESEPDSFDDELDNPEIDLIEDEDEEDDFSFEVDDSLSDEPLDFDLDPMTTNDDNDSDDGVDVFAEEEVEPDFEDDDEFSTALSDDANDDDEFAMDSDLSSEEEAELSSIIDDQDEESPMEQDLFNDPENESDALDEEEFSEQDELNEDGFEENDLDEDLAELDLGTPAMVASAAASSIEHEGAPTEPPHKVNQGNDMSKKLGIFLFLLALIIGGAGAFMAFTASSGLTMALAEIETLKNQKAAATRSDPRIPKIAESVDQLNTRLNEIAAIIDGPISHMNESGDANESEAMKKIEALSQHISMVDEVISALESQQEKLAIAISSTPARKTEATTSVDTPEVAASQPEPSSSGRWSLNLQSLSSEKNAMETVKELKDIGVSAVMRKSTSGDKVWHRVRIEGFNTYNEAKAYIKKLPVSPLTANPWVTNN